MTSSSPENVNCSRPFRVAQPCPQDVANAVTVDTTKLVDGTREATLRVFDATEQNYVSYGPIRFATENRRLANFCASDRVVKLTTNVPGNSLPLGRSWTYRARVRGAAGQEAVLLDGENRLELVGTSTISRSGRVSFRVPPGTSRMLRLAARPPGATTLFACSVPARLRVRSRIRLSVTPDEVSNGRSIRLRGRLLGESRSNQSVIIQARARREPSLVNGPGSAYT